jgi:ArsR family transcriptional regulator, virulence genes transcriptional regulator
MVDSAGRMTGLQEKAVKVGGFLKALSNPARLLVLCQIADGEKSVGELERSVDLSQSSLSQHLAVLRREQIVATRRMGSTIFYSIASREAMAVMLALYDIFCSQIAKKPSPKAQPRRRKTAAA